MTKKVAEMNVEEGLSIEGMVNKLKHYLTQREQAIEFLTKVNAVVEFLDYEINQLQKKAEAEKPKVEDTKEVAKPTKAK